ncbi:MAG: hypothetical protein ACJ74Y_06380, partial [Bryobacteraceae bacterium]
CAASAPFYRKLVQAGAHSRKVHFVAVLPQDVAASKAYLASLGLMISDVRQAKLQDVKTPYTPTLLMLDDQGIVKSIWIGQLPTAKEEDVLQTTGLGDLKDSAATLDSRSVER